MWPTPARARAQDTMLMREMEVVAERVGEDDIGWQTARRLNALSMYAKRAPSLPTPKPSGGAPGDKKAGEEREAKGAPSGGPGERAAAICVGPGGEVSTAGAAPEGASAGRGSGSGRGDGRTLGDGQGRNGPGRGGAAGAPVSEPGSHAEGGMGGQGGPAANWPGSSEIELAPSGGPQRGNATPPV